MTACWCSAWTRDEGALGEMSDDHGGLWSDLPACLVLACLWRGVCGGKDKRGMSGWNAMRDKCAWHLCCGGGLSDLGAEFACPKPPSLLAPS